MEVGVKIERSDLPQEIKKSFNVIGMLAFADNTDAIQLHKQRGWNHMHATIIFGKEFP